MCSTQFHFALFAVLAVIGVSCDRPHERAVEPATAESTLNERPDTPDAATVPPRFTSDEIVERFAPADAAVVVHFTRLGPNQVFEKDSDNSGTPDVVEFVSATYAEVVSSARLQGFRQPLEDSTSSGVSGGDSRLDVYLLDFGKRADGTFRIECEASDGGACSGYIAQENDFAGYGYDSTETAIRLVSSHEYFHAIQASYLPMSSVVLSEGTAVWASEQFDPSLRDLETFSGAYLATPERSLTQEPVGPADAYAYGAGLFFECLVSIQGPDIVQQLFASLQPQRKWTEALEGVLQRHNTSLRAVLRQCLTFNLFTGTRARGSYGHRRAEQLALSPVTSAATSVVVPRVALFRASSRFFRVEAADEARAIWWKPLSVIGAEPLEVLVVDDSDAAVETRSVPADLVTPLGQAAHFVLVEHLSAAGATVPLSRCAGSRAVVERCRTGDFQMKPEVPPLADSGAPTLRTTDSGESDSGVMTDPPEPAGAPPAPNGCTAAAGAPLLGLLWVLRRWLIGAAGIAPLAAHAQMDAGVSAFPLRQNDAPAEITTIVTAARVAEPQSRAVLAVEVLTRKAIAESGARDLAEALQARAGLETFSNVGGVGLRMQGLGPEYNLVLIDGQRVAGRINGGVDLQRVSVEQIEQVEIVKGPSSVLWGSDALAGVVNIITRKASRPLGGAVTSTFGPLNQLDLRAEAEASTSNTGVLVTAGIRHRDAYDLAPLTPATSGSAVDAAQAGLRVAFGKADKQRPQTDFRVHFSRRSQLGIDSNASGAVFDRRSRDNLGEARLGTAFRTPTGQFELSTSASLFDRLFIVDQRNSSVLDSVQNSLDLTWQVDALLDSTLGRFNQAVLGAQLLFERLSTPRLNSLVATRWRGALFAQDSYTPIEWLSLSGGVRLDFDSGFGFAVTPRLSTKVAAHKTLILTASSGLGFRAPSFQDLFLDFENESAGYVVLGNPKLRAERSFGSNLGASWQPMPRLSLSLSLFWNELWDMLTYAASSRGAVTQFQYVNASRGRSRGLESSLTVTVPGPVALTAGYTLTDARNLEGDTPLDGQSTHRWFGQARYRNRPFGVTAQLRASVTGARPFSGPQGTQSTAAFVLLDARVAKTISSAVELFVAGNNLLQAGDVSTLPIAPRSVFCGLTIQPKFQERH